MSALDDIQKGWSLPANNCPVDFTAHAVEQTNERHFRRLDPERARHELYAKLERAVVTQEAPPWVFKREAREKVRAWLVLEREQLCWPLYAGRGPQAGALVAGTCLSPRQTPTGAEVHVRRGGTQRQRQGQELGRG